MAIVTGLTARTYMLPLLFGALLVSCAPAQSTLTPDEAKEIAKTAFFWGMHPVAYYHFRHNYTQNDKSPVFSGLNRIGWNREPITADFRAATTPNATTMYGIGVYDLRAEPVVISVPAIKNRYWSVQATDQYARWFLKMGNQWTGADAQQGLLVGPEWIGQLPTGFTGSEILRVPSNYLFLIFRLGLKNYSKEEISTVNSYMDEITAVPLSLWEKNNRNTVAAKDQKCVMARYQTIPGMDTVADPSKLEPEEFYQWVNLVINDPSMTKQADSAKEVAALRDLERLGIKEGGMFNFERLPSAHQAAVREGYKEAKEEAIAAVTGMTVDMNKWNLGTDFDYSDTNWVLRASYGLQAIAGPVPSYSHTGAFGIVDSEGLPMNGRDNYTLTFDMDSLPPVTEFWSIPMYDLAGYFIDNPINRYTVNSFMLENGDFHITTDRKLVFYLQTEKPNNPDKAKNWLPTPKDEGFRFAARYYGPSSPLIDGSYQMPLPVKVDD